MENKITVFDNIMIDIETTGLRPGCHIVGIGACAFPQTSNGTVLEDKLFLGYANINDDRFQADPETMAWWDTRSTLVKEQLHQSDNRVDSLLIDFASYLRQFKSIRVWGNAASFDLKILEHAYLVCNMKVPWHFRSEMCYRTLSNLFPNIPYNKPRNSHMALDDAIAQAVHTIEIFNYISALQEGFKGGLDQVTHTELINRTTTKGKTES